MRIEKKEMVRYKLKRRKRKQGEIICDKLEKKGEMKTKGEIICEKDKLERKMIKFKKIENKK